MPGNRQKGRLAALSVVNQAQAKATAATVDEDVITAVVEAIQGTSIDVNALAAALSEASTPAEPVDLAPVVQAIKQTAPAAVNFGPLVEALEGLRLEAPAIDLAPVQGELKNIRKAIESSNAMLAGLTKAVKASKIVKYDDQGRVVEIKVK